MGIRNNVSSYGKSFSLTKFLASDLLQIRGLAHYFASIGSNIVVAILNSNSQPTLIPTFCPTSVPPSYPRSSSIAYPKSCTIKCSRKSSQWWIEDNTNLHPSCASFIMSLLDPNLFPPLLQAPALVQTHLLFPADMPVFIIPTSDPPREH